MLQIISKLQIMSCKKTSNSHCLWRSAECEEVNGYGKEE